MVFGLRRFERREKEQKGRKKKKKLELKSVQELLEEPLEEEEILVEEPQD